MLAAADPEQAGLSAAGLARLSAVMQREVDARHVPGVAMLIARGGKVGYRRDIGALRPDGPPMPSDAIFRIYSMTKPIVSVALMMLVEEGQLFIADPIAKFVPEFANPKVGIEKDGKLELVAAERRHHHPGSAAPHIGTDLCVHRQFGGAAPLCRVAFVYP